MRAGERALLRGRGPTLIHLCRREQGLLVPQGNPARITGPADLRGRRVAKREHGAGTRVLLGGTAAAALPRSGARSTGAATCITAPTHQLLPVTSHAHTSHAHARETGGTKNGQGQVNAD